MSGQQPLEPSATPTQQAHRRADLSHGVPKWFTVRQLTRELQFPSEDACRTWLRRQGIANVRRGRVILVSPVDVDRALRGAR